MVELAEIQDFTQAVVRAITAVVDLPVLIADRHRRRIAGTDRWENRLGTIMDEGFLLPQVISQGATIAVYNPTKEPVCKRCPTRFTCNEKATLAVPIRAHGELIGAFGLVAVTEAQRDNLRRNHDSLLQFLDGMSELLAAKAAEREHARHLQHLASEREAIIDAIHEGVVAVDCDLRVTHRNAAANRLLRVRAQEPLALREPMRKLLANVIRTGTRLQDEEVVLEGSPRVHLFVSARPILVCDQITGAVAWLKDAAQVLKLAADVSAAGGPALQFEDIIGESSVMLEAKDLARQVARGRSTVLLTGESGTGKEVFARAIHSASPRRGGPFRAVNCAAIPDTLLESELFGYEEGAFSGARRKGKPGKFELSNGGTLFLDEIADMPLHLQAKLLRVIQERRIEPLGGTHPVDLDVRIIAATNRDLSAMVARSEFRQDLFYRLNVIPVHLPPLRERQQDIPLLVSAFVEKQGQLLGKPGITVGSQAMELLQRYAWPGNVRELENAVEHAVALEKSMVITPASLPGAVRTSVRLPVTEEPPDADPMAARLRELLARYGKSVPAKRQIAGELGISLATLYRRLALLENSHENHGSA